MAWKKAVLSVAIYQEGYSPVYGTGSTHVTIEDDAGGPYFKIKQCDDDSEVGTICVDLDELKLIYETAAKMERDYPGSDK